MERGVMTKMKNKRRPRKEAFFFLCCFPIGEFSRSFGGGCYERKLDVGMQLD